MNQLEPEQLVENNNIDDNVEKELECSICHELLVAPVTLMCQHTFCRLCIKSYVDKQSKPGVSDDGYQVYVPKKDKNAKCPLCRCTVVIPVNDNFILKGIIESKYPELYRTRYKEFHTKGLLKLDIRDQVEEEIRNEIFNSVVDEAVHENNDGGGINGGDRGGSPFVAIPGLSTAAPSWVAKIFPSQSTLTIAWGIILIAAVAIMIKLGVNIRTYVGVCVVMWGVYVYLLNQY